MRAELQSVDQTNLVVAVHVVTGNEVILAGLRQAQMNFQESVAAEMLC